MERQRSATKERLSFLPNSLRIYRLLHNLADAIVRMFSLFTGLLMGTGLILCSILLYLMTSIVAPVTERFLAGGTLLMLLILATFMQSIAGRVYSRSRSLIAFWRQRSGEEWAISLETWMERRRWLGGIRPMQVVAAGSYYVDQLQELHFFNAVVDNTILIWQIFPH